MTIKWIGAHPNNFQKGRAGHQPQTIVLHWIVGTLAAADSTFQDPARRASATYGVGPKGIHQYVKEEDTAYANGNYQSNLTSISIEHEGGPTISIADSTYRNSVQLVADIAKRYKIPLDRQHVKGHRDISPTQCPGTLDLDRIIREAQALLQPAPTPATPAFNDQTKLSLGEPWGTLELGAVRSILNDQKRDLKAAEEQRKTYFEETVALRVELANARLALKTAQETAPADLSALTSSQLISELFRRLSGR